MELDSGSDIEVDWRLIRDQLDNGMGVGEELNDSGAQASTDIPRPPSSDKESNADTEDNRDDSDSDWGLCEDMQLIWDEMEHMDKVSPFFTRLHSPDGVSYRTAKTSSSLSPPRQWID
jgi:hypothetical protein